MHRSKLSDSAELIDGFLSKDRCIGLIKLAESKGFEDAPVILNGKPSLAKEIRNNTRVMIDDVNLASELWERIENHISITVVGWKPIALNERFRFYRYTPMQSFKLHKDFAYESGNHKSFFSLIIYLNESFQGGETDFGRFKILPKTGRAAIFKHDLFHEGCEVTYGVKYAVRTDIMCEKIA